MSGICVGRWEGFCVDDIECMCLLPPSVRRYFPAIPGFTDCSTYDGMDPGSTLPVQACGPACVYANISSVTDFEALREVTREHMEGGGAGGGREGGGAFRGRGRGRWGGKEGGHSGEGGGCSSRRRNTEPALP